MRDRRFVAEHRGGPLKIEQHRQLMRWAIGCAEHVFPLSEGEIDERLNNAILVARKWADGNASVGEARKAAMGAIAVANESSDPVNVAIARTTGHAVATAHMADHSLGAALYALKAIHYKGNSPGPEKKWQANQLPIEIKSFILTTFKEKEKHHSCP